jgi:protein TonB
VFRTLIESNPPKQRRRASTIASVVLHTTAIGGAIVATASARPSHLVEPRPRQPQIIYAEINERSGAIHRRATSVSRQRARPADAVRDIRAPVWSLRNAEAVTGPFVDVSPEGMLARDRSLTCAVTRCERGPDSVAATVAGGLATIATVERPAALRTPPRPRYPEQLRAAGVTGRVVVRLVVDTLGRIEPATIVIRESSHDLFTHAVRAVLPGLRFIPAEAGGRKVRMLIELPFDFRLDE